MQRERAVSRSGQRRLRGFPEEARRGPGEKRRAKRLEYCVRYVELPLAVNGLTVLDADGFYNIYINAAHTREKQAQTLRHELRHVRRGDFFSRKPIEELERP